MANIMNLTKLRNNVSRNGFDLSRKNLFTAKVGEMLPVACLECIPGDDMTIDMAWFTRTQPINTAAYTRMREYYDWYFVPTNLLWKNFNTFFSQMTDNNQKATGINGNVRLTDEHPYFTFEQIAQYIQDMYGESKENFFGFSRAELSCKLLHYLDYGDFSGYLKPESSTPVSQFSNAKLNPFPLLAYQKIYQDYVRDSQWEKAYAPASNIDYMTGAEGQNNIPVSQIDRNNENMFDLRYMNWNKDYFMGLLPNSQYGDAASIVTGGSIQLGDVNYYTKGNPQAAGVSGSAIELSQSVRESASNLIPESVAVGNSNYLRFKYTRENGNEATTTPIIFFSKEQMLNFRDALGLSSLESSDLNSAFTILALRQMEAKQKWAEIVQSNQQDFASQMRAIFNVDVSDAYSDRCRYIGGVSGSVDIDPVVNQNLADNNEADIAGRGQGGSRGSIKFNTKVPGYLMCIYHARPVLDFAIDGIKRQNLKTSVHDYANPVFDKTGMIAVPLVELTTTYMPTDATTVDETLLGYAPRYIDYKTSYDLVHGAFFNGGLDAWVAPIDKNYINEYLNNMGAAVANGAFNYHFFKIPPSVLNPIFAISADSSVDTDQLLINAAFDIKAVRNLDRNGLPY